jgi:hypothetical protein
MPNGKAVMINGRLAKESSLPHMKPNREKIEAEELAKGETASY